MYFKSNYNDLEQLSDEQFTDVLKQIIEKETESEFLDFKKEVHANNAELMKDIISLANNADEVDGLLVFGVKDKVVYGVTPLKFEEYVVGVLVGNRSKFAGQAIPKIYVRNTKVQGNNIVIIIIKNSIKTPFYLIEDYRDKEININAYVTYNRNLSNKGIASDSEIEKLWAKRFGLNKTSLDRFLHLNNARWKFINKNSNNYAEKYVFNEDNPEYTIRFLEAKGLNNYPYSKVLNIFNGYEKNYKGRLQVLFHSVVIYEDDYFFLKDCEYTEKNRNGERNQRYIPRFREVKLINMNYYLMDTIQGKLIRALNNGKLNFFSGRDRLEYGHYLVFFNDNDFDDFFDFIIKELSISIEPYDKNDPMHSYNPIHSYDFYLHKAFDSEEFRKSFEDYINESKENNFSLLPTNFRDLLSEQRMLGDITDSMTRVEFHRVMEKAYMFDLYLKWRKLDENEFNQFLENMN